jgi:hypothetical protein
MGAEPIPGTWEMAGVGALDREFWLREASGEGR